MIVAIQKGMLNVTYYSSSLNLKASEFSKKKLAIATALKTALV